MPMVGARLTVVAASVNDVPARIWAAPGTSLSSGFTTGVRLMGVRTQARRSVMILLLGAGAVALGVSTQLDRIWWILVFFLVGMTCLSLLLLQINDALAARLRTGELPWWPWAFVGMTLFGFVVVAYAIANESYPIVAIAGMVLLTLGMIGLFLWVGRHDAVAVGGGDSPSIGVGSAAWYGFEAMAVGIGLFLISDGTASIVGSIAWLGGLVAIKIGSIPYLESRGDDLARTVRVLADVTLLGLFVMFAGAFTSNAIMLLVGLSVVTAALSMLGVGALSLDCPARKAWWAMGLALFGMAVVWGWMAYVLQNPGLAFVLGLMIALTGGFFVLRGEGIVLLMLAAYLLAWGLVDRSVTIAETVPTVTGKPVQIVALGDSFISGEGAPEFFEGTNEAGGNQCRRAPTAHPYLIAQALGTNVLSLACSGAKIADLTTCGQMWPDGRRCRARPEPVAPADADVAGDNGGADGDGADDGADGADDDAAAEVLVADPDAPNPLVGVWGDALALDVANPPGALPQLVTAIDRGATVEADVVLLSIGGNDVGFSSIVKACLLPKGCEERREIWLDAIDLLGPQLDEVYAEVRRAFPTAEVLVMPYPMLVNAERRTSCDLGLSQEEREFVVDFIQKLDLTIADAAARAGFVFVAEGVDAFEGAQLCDDRAGANHLKLVPPAGDPLGRYSPATWIPGSMHPNVVGHELTAEAAVCRAAEALDLVPVSGVVADDRPFECVAAQADGGGDVDGGAGDGGDGGDDGGAGDDEVPEVVDRQLEELAAEVAAVTDELVSDDEWIRVELFRTVRALALPLMLLLAAGMVFAWGFVQLNNPFSRFLRQEPAD